MYRNIKNLNEINDYQNNFKSRLTRCSSSDNLKSVQNVLEKTEYHKTMNQTTTQYQILPKSHQETLFFLSNDNQNLLKLPKLFTFPKVNTLNNIEENKSSKFVTKKRGRKNKIKEKEKQKSINSVSPKKNFLKVNNEIYTLSELKNYFREIKDKERDEEKEEKEEEKEENQKEIKNSEIKEKEFNKREILINNLKDKINGYISNQKNQYHDELKKKVEKLLFCSKSSLLFSNEILDFFSVC